MSHILWHFFLLYPWRDVFSLSYWIKKSSHMSNDTFFFSMLFLALMTSMCTYGRCQMIGLTMMSWWLLVEHTWYFMATVPLLTRFALTLLYTCWYQQELRKLLRFVFTNNVDLLGSPRWSSYLIYKNIALKFAIIAVK